MITLDFIFIYARLPHLYRFYLSFEGKEQKNTRHIIAENFCIDIFMGKHFLLRTHTAHKNLNIAKQILGLSTTDRS